MMTLERKLAQEDLNKFKTDPLKLLARQFVQYSRHKTSFAMQKINRMGYSETTAKFMFEKSCQYLSGSKGVKGLNKKLVLYLDECVANAVQPLQPSKENERRIVGVRAQRIDRKRDEEKAITEEKARVVYLLVGDTGNIKRASFSKDELRGYAAALYESGLLKKICYLEAVVRESSK